MSTWGLETLDVYLGIGLSVLCEMSLMEIGFQVASEEEQQKGESPNEKESVTGEKERAGQHGEEKDVLGDSEDEQMLQEFEEEIADLSVPSDRIEEIKEEMQKEFDNIIDEVSSSAFHRLDSHLNDGIRDPSGSFFLSIHHHNHLFTTGFAV